jgi:hypothetical protein
VISKSDKAFSISLTCDDSWIEAIFVPILLSSCFQIDYHRILTRKCIEWDQFGVLCANCPVLFATSAPTIAINNLKLHNIFTSTTVDRKICAIDGALLGHAPLSVRDGDQVWLLDGGRVPYALRSTNGVGCHTLVGDCYVHGVMEGEKWGSLWKKPKMTNVPLV